MDLDQYIAVMEDRRASKGWRLLQRELPKIVGAPKYIPPNSEGSEVGAILFLLAVSVFAFLSLLSNLLR